MIVLTSSLTSSHDALPCLRMEVLDVGCTDEAVIDESNFSCSRLDRIVIGGGGGPANIVDPLRNCYNELFCRKSRFDLGRGSIFNNFRFHRYMF